ncbi:nucleolar transcription factor 1-like [Thalassophryne amazonica]|uniref:nucleolar transcription factor 1-like n=1 Tax=Thalassophryne amazonica TaxID=390379 RepID=UPI0014724D00|nr:nucleolar transcription factor 1-like [Thalassophryne amazonica]
MNGSSSISVSAQTTSIKAEQDDWSKDDCLILLERIRSLLPDGDTMKYKTTESHFDWEKVRFGGFTGDMCRQKWHKVSCEVRKYRTMTELIVDAIEFVKNPYKGKKLKTHPDFPKKPLTPYFRFFMEKRAKYAKIHPEMSNLDLTKILSKKYKELPEKKKQKYITEFQREKEAFEKNMARFKEDHPELIEERKKSDLPEKPKTPQQLWYNHEKKTYMKLHPEVCLNKFSLHNSLVKFAHNTGCFANSYVYFSIQRQIVGGSRSQSDRRKAQVAMEATWKSMEKKEKIPWIKKAAEDQKRYEVQYQPVRELLEMRAPPAAQGQRKPKFDGEPKKPPVSGYQMFSQELLTNGELNHFSLKERMVEIGKRWQKLSQSQKDKYKKQVEEQQVEYKAELDAWIKALSPQDRAVYKDFVSSKRRSSTKVHGAPGAKVHLTAKGKALSSRLTTPGVTVGKRAMAYRAKQDISDSDEEEEKSNSSDSDEDDETSGSTDSDEDDDDDDENNDDDEDEDEDQTSSDESSESESD